MTGCVFCGKDDLAYSRLDRYPATAGHTLVCPGRHVATIFDCTPEELVAMWELVEEAAQFFRSGDPTITGFNVGFNAGVSAGQTVMHAHVHVIPRRDGDAAENPGIRGAIR